MIDEVKKVAHGVRSSRSGISFLVIKNLIKITCNALRAPTPIPDITQFLLKVEFVLPRMWTIDASERPRKAAIDGTKEASD